jgi:DNA mismatch repair ATPase MutL
MILHLRRVLECVHYYRIINLISKGNYPSQKLLFPESYIISESDLPIWNNASESIKSLGIEYQYVGNNNWEITGKPAGLDDVISISELIDDILDTLRIVGEVDKNKLTEKLAEKLAYKYSLSAKSAIVPEGLVEELMATPSPTYTPSGLNTFIYLTKDELENKFGR